MLYITPILIVIPKLGEFSTPSPPTFFLASMILYLIAVILHAFFFLAHFSEVETLGLHTLINLSPICIKHEDFIRAFSTAHESDSNMIKVKQKS